MKPEHVVSIILVLVAVLVVAGFLIAVVVELRRTHLQLITILGAVVDTVENTNALEGVVNEIADDLAFGQNALTECVDRLEQRLGGPSTAEEPGVAPEPTPPPAAPVTTPWSPPRDVFSNH
jgi:hypothetical protein